MGQYDLAIETFNKALAVTFNPEYDIHDRGMVYEETKRFDLAISDFTKAMEMKPDEKDFVAQCYNDRGVAYFKSEQYDKSWQDASKAMDMGYSVNPVFLSALEEKGYKK